MEKINFKNLPDRTTPLNATNLNQLQTNIENEFVDSNDFKNLFNKNNVLKGYIAINSINENLTTDNLSRTTEWISCKSNTYYTIQGGDRRRIQYKNANGIITYSNYSTDSNNVLTFLTSSDTVYFRIYIVNNIEEISVDDIQIEEGAVATSYKPFVPKNVETELIKRAEIMFSDVSAEEKSYKFDLTKNSIYLLIIYVTGSSYLVDIVMTKYNAFIKSTLKKEDSSNYINISYSDDGTVTFNTTWSSNRTIVKMM